MKLLQVNYRRALSKDDQGQAERIMQSAIKIAGVKGLLWKIWIYDDEEKTAGGIYLFDSEANARNWGGLPPWSPIPSSPPCTRRTPS